MPDASSSQKTSSVTAWLERALFSRREWVLAAFLIVTLAMAWLAAGLRVDAGFTKLVPLEHSYMRTFVKHRAAFGGCGPRGGGARGAGGRHLHA